MKNLSTFIDGKYYSDKHGELFLNINPANQDVVCQVEETTRFLFEKTIESSLKAFKQWSSLSVIDRCRKLKVAAKLLIEHNDALALMEVEDSGKPWQEASTLDIISGAECLEYYAGLAPAQVGSQQSVNKDFFYTRKEPFGIVAGIGAWNYPLQIACWKAAPALASGNVMIFKPSEETPRSAAKLAEIFIEAGINPGVFNVVQGGAEVGTWLCEHPLIRKVSFTGEVATGCQVMKAASSNLKSLTLELGGKSPLIVFDDADLNQSVAAAMLGNFYTQGEICTNATRVFVHDAIYDSFISELTKQTLSGIRIGDPKDPNTNFGALISKKHYQKVLNYIELGLEEGAKLLLGGKPVDTTDCQQGFFVEPTIFIDCHDEMAICSQEIFGPIMSILTFKDEDDVIRRANNTNYGLAAGIFTENIQKAHRVAHKIEAGVCWINQYGVSPIEMPVGGFKQSGLGQENGIETLNQYCQTKSIYVGLESIKTPFR